jgi:hypothetical protein
MKSSSLTTSIMVWPHNYKKWRWINVIYKCITFISVWRQTRVYKYLLALRLNILHSYKDFGGPCQQSAYSPLVISLTPCCALYTYERLSPTLHTQATNLSESANGNTRAVVSVVNIPASWRIRLCAAWNDLSNDTNTSC